MGEHLDELSKSLASGMSRRQALWRFIAGAMGAAAVTLVPGRAAAAKRNTTATCAQCCAHYRGVDRLRCLFFCLTDPYHSCNVNISL
jgi:hypothetical protein